MPGIDGLTLRGSRSAILTTSSRAKSPQTGRRTASRFRGCARSGNIGCDTERSDQHIRRSAAESFGYLEPHIDARGFPVVRLVEDVHVPIAIEIGNARFVKA